MTTKPLTRLLLTPGEPAGIGPDIVIEIAKRDWPVELIAIADPSLLAERAKTLGYSLQCLPCDLNGVRTAHRKHTLKILPVALASHVIPGQLNRANANYVINTLDKAATLCEEKKAEAIVTGPVHKGIINDATIPFTGHTEFFGKHCKAALTMMLFDTDQIKVALATTHLPLSAVSKAITKDQLQSMLLLMHDELKTKFHLHHPKIIVCGLNPHAGEGGHFGCEEIDIMLPVILALQAKQYDMIGPLPADTAFIEKKSGKADAILAMYHDQALPLIKYISFGHAVNMTLGLPYIRTSVDHGTALDIAGSGQADAQSMEAALQLAIKLTSSLAC